MFFRFFFGDILPGLFLAYLILGNIARLMCFVKCGHVARCSNTHCKLRAVCSSFTKQMSAEEIRALEKQINISLQSLYCISTGPDSENAR